MTVLTSRSIVTRATSRGRGLTSGSQHTSSTLVPSVAAHRSTGGSPTSACASNHSSFTITTMPSRT